VAESKGGSKTVFGSNKPVQSNKPNKPGSDYVNRSPKESNAAKSRASLLEKDTGTAVKRDVQRVGRGLNPTGKSALTRAAQTEAAGRATTRLASRLGYAGAAFTAGTYIGDKINEMYPDLGKKAVDKTVGKVIDELAVKGKRAELTADAKKRVAKIIKQKVEGEGKDQRINPKDYPTYQKKTESAGAFRDAFKKAKDDDKKTFSFEGRTYKVEDGPKQMMKGGYGTKKMMGGGYSMKGKK
jgi:hypothetical protein